MQKEKKTRRVDNYLQLVIISTGVSLFWLWQNNGHRMSLFDDLLYVLFPIGFMCIPFFIWLVDSMKK